MDDLVRSGKVRYVGASNVTGWQMQKIMDYCNFMGLNKWVTLQVSDRNDLGFGVKIQQNLTQICCHLGVD